MAIFRRGGIRQSFLADAARVLILALTVSAGAGLATGTSRAEPLAALATGAMANFNVSKAPEPAPEIRFFDEEGTKITLGDFEGRVVLLNFWATWCAPCRREMPDFAELQREFGPDGFDVVAVSGDRQGPAVVQPFYDEIGVKDLIVYNDRTMKAQRAFRVYGLPTTMLIDREGREIGRLLGPAEWASADAKALIAQAVGKAGEN